MLEMNNNLSICIICINAQQPPYNTMLRYHNWGKELVKRGNRVSIITSNWVHNTDINVIQKIGKACDIVDGVEYYYVETSHYERNGLKRILNLAEFSLKIRSKKHFVGTPDVIISTGAVMLPFVRSSFKGCPIITDIVDLWPQSIIEYAGYSRKHPMIRFLYYMEKKAYLTTDALIFSMEGGADYIREQSYAKLIDFKKVFHINMGCDIKQKDMELKKISFNLGWPAEKFNIVYCGSIRQANQVSLICEAAYEIQSKGIDKVYFHIYGNGDELDKLKEYAMEHKLHNIKFYGRIEKEKIPFILSHADANILTYKQVPLMKYGGSQSKLFDYLASGKPIICNAKFGYNLVERYNCGIVTEAQTPQAFCAAVEYLLGLDKDNMIALGKNSRMVAEMYDQPRLVDKLSEVIDYVCLNGGT